MSHSLRSLRLPALAVLALIAAMLTIGCGVPYVVTAQTGQYPPRNATIQIAPLTFAREANLDNGVAREDGPTWDGHTTAWSEKYQLRLLEHGRKKGLHLQPGVQPGAPLVLRTNVLLIDKNSSTYMGRDHVTADVMLVDASNSVLWSARLEAESRGAGPSGYTFGGRVGWACETLANAIVEVLAGEPAEGSMKTQK